MVCQSAFLYLVTLTTKSSHYTLNSHLYSNTASFGRHSPIQLVLNEVRRSFTVSQETLPGGGQAPHWKKTDNWTSIRGYYASEPGHKRLHIKSLMKQLWCWQLLLLLRWLFALISTTDAYSTHAHIHRGAAWDPSLSLMMSTEPQEEHGEEWRTLGNITNAHCVLRITYLSCATVFRSNTA